MSAKRRADPRRPDSVVPFSWPEPRKDESGSMDSELIGFLAMSAGMYGLFVQLRVMSWVSLFLGIVAQVNATRATSPAGSGMNAIVFSVLALALSFANDFFPGVLSGTYFKK